MGLDMLLYSTPLPTIDGVPSSGPEARQAVVDAIARWTPGDIDPTELEWLLSCAGMDQDAYGEETDACDALVDAEHPRHTALIEKIRALLADALDDVWEANEAVYGNRSVIFQSDRIVSGGLSGGDAPTDACESIELLAAAGVTAQAITTAAGQEAARRKEIATAVTVIFGHLSDRDTEIFDGLLVDSHLVAVCSECGWHIPLDEADTPCEGCGNPGPHQ